MNNLTTLSLAASALFRNTLRSLLTTLGVVIGVAAVVIMHAMGQGATDLVTGEIQNLGSNMLVIIPGGDSRQAFGSGLLSAQLFRRTDLDAIRRECDAVRYVSASNSLAVRAVMGEKNRATTLFGTTPEHYATRDWHAALGRLLNEEDEQQAAKVCMLGETVRRDLFGAGNPLGSELRVQHVNCRIVGVLKAKGVSTFGTDQDDLVFMPSTTFQRRLLGTDRLGMMMVSAVSEARTDEARTQIMSLLRQRRHVRPGDDDDFAVRDLREVQALLSKVTGVLTSLLAGVAAVSLVVGGIGIMNIMLVSVTERTREIGIRLAVGARPRDILKQFLVESVLLSSVGGLLGLGIGLLGAYFVSRGMHIPYSISPRACALAFGFAALVGVVFGVVPARKASKLHPIAALRYE
ncbi:MAG TPA: ABC transporter permease [Polyangiales bacterium]